MQGQYFDKKRWDGRPAPRWEQVRPRLPQPVLEGEDDALAAYWRAWELAVRSMKSPEIGSGFVSNFMYMEFSNAIFQHDTATMVLFGRYGLRAFAAIESVDNFYARQHETGEICREIRLNGEDYWPNRGGRRMRVAQTQEGKGYDWTPPFAPGPGCCALEGLNTPSAMLRAEWAHYEISGDRDRLARILPAQQKWFEAFDTYVKDSNGLFVTDWASVDNAPRNDHDIGYGAEVAGEMCLLAELLARVCAMVGDEAGRARYARYHDDLAERIRRRMWDEPAGMFFSLDRAGGHIRVKGVMEFVPLVAGVPTPGEAARLVAHLEDPREFNRPVRIPSLAADEPEYQPTGDYVKGGCWPFANALVIAGLERYGHGDLAAEIALNHWRASVQVFRDTGTVWEYIAPEKAEPGRSASVEGHNARPDFAGWGAHSPIAHLLEYAIGLRPDAPANTLTWNLREIRACGCRQYAFGDVTADLLAEPRKSPDDEPVIRVKTDKPFTLVVNWGRGRSKTIVVGDTAAE